MSTKVCQKINLSLWNQRYFT